MQRLIATGAGIVLAAFLLTARAYADDDERLIEYGESVGKIRLGMVDKEVEATLGKPANVQAHADTEVETWQSRHGNGQPELTVVLFNQDKHHHHWEATEMIVTSPYFRTKAGNASGSDTDALWQEFPVLRFAGDGTGVDGSHQELYDSREIGVGFMVERSATPDGPRWGKCRGIVVHRIGQEPKFPFLPSLLKPAGGG